MANLLDLAALVGTDQDPTVAEVVSGAGFRLRLRRVASTAPMLQGVSALFMVAPGLASAPKDGKPAAPASLLTGPDAKRIGDIMEAVLLESVTGTRGGPDEPWVPVRLVRQEAQQDLADGKVWIGVLTSVDQARCYDALVKLHAGEGLATLIATAFRFAADSLAASLARAAVRVRPVDGGELEPGEDGLQHGDPAGGGAGSSAGDAAARG